MNGDEAWMLYERAVHQYVSHIPAQERHKYASKLLGMSQQLFTSRFGPAFWEEVSDARYRAGYHR